MTQALKIFSKLPCVGSTEPRMQNLSSNESRKNSCYPGVFYNNLHSVEPNLFEEKSLISWPFYLKKTVNQVHVTQTQTLFNFESQIAACFPTHTSRFRIEIHGK